MIKVDWFCRVVGAMFVLSSCGSIVKDSKDLIIIDSQFRGATISDVNRNELGKTPFIYSMERKREQYFFLDKEKLEVNYTCQFDFGESIIPNGIFSALTFPFGAISFGVDWYNGRMYKCNKAVYFKNTQEIKRDKLKFNILIVPPNTNSYYMANKVMKEFELLEGRRKREKLNYVRLDNDLAELGVDSYTKINKENYNRRILNPLLEKNQIDYLLFFDINDSSQNGSLSVRPRLIDVFTKKVIVNSYDEFQIKMESISSLKLVFDRIHIIPNSIKMMSNHFNQAEDSLPLDKHPHSFPKVISLFSMGNVYNPLNYDSWDLDFYGATSFSLPAFKSSISEHDYLFRSTVFTFNGGLLLKSPFGALNFEIGYGGLLLYQKPVEVNQNLYACASVGLSYTFFFTKKFFYQTQWQLLDPSNMFLQHSPIRIAQVSLGIGYLVTELDHLFRSSWAKD